MTDSNDLKTRTKTFRLSTDEEAEVDAHLQRVGGSQSDFFRNAILARARGTVDFAEMLPMFAETMERQMSDLARSVQSHTAGIQTLAAAAVASSAMVHDDGKTMPAETIRLIEDQIRRAVAYAPQVVSFLPNPVPGAAPAGPKSR